MHIFIPVALLLGAQVLAGRYNHQTHMDADSKSEDMVVFHGDISNARMAGEEGDLRRAEADQKQTNEILIRDSSFARISLTCDEKRKSDPTFRCLREGPAVLTSAQGEEENVQIGKCLGAGGYGLVFSDREDHQIIKIYSGMINYQPQALSYLQSIPKKLDDLLDDEALSKLRSRNDVDQDVLEQGVSGFVPFLFHGQLKTAKCGPKTFYTQIAERAAGRNLYDWLQDWAVPPGLAFAHVGIGMFSSLYLLQLRNRMHGDFQLSNIMWDGQGPARLVDYDYLAEFPPQTPVQLKEKEAKDAQKFLKIVLRMTPPYFVDICKEVDTASGCNVVAEGLQLQESKVRFKATSLQPTPNMNSKDWLTFSATFDGVDGEWVVKYANNENLQFDLGMIPVVDDFPVLDEDDDSAITAKVGERGLVAYREAMAKLASGHLADAAHSLEAALP